MTMRIGNAGSGLDGGLALRCQNSGESQLPCLTLPWQRDTNQGFRRVKEQECQLLSQGIAMTFPPVLWFSSLSPGSPLHASPWLSLLASPSVPLQRGSHGGSSAPPRPQPWSSAPR